MQIDFSRAMQALQKIAQLQVHLMIDAAFPTYTEERRLELEQQRNRQANTFEFYMSLEEIDRGIFNEFLNKLIDTDVQELIESLQPAPLTDAELSPPDPVEVRLVGKNYVVCNGDSAIADFSINGELTEAQQKMYAIMFQQAFNALYPNRISPTTIEHLKFYASRGEAFRSKHIGASRMAYQCIYEQAYYIRWENNQDDHELIDLNMIPKSIKERIVNNYGYTLGKSRRGMLSIEERFPDPHLQIALYVFLYFENRRNKGAAIPSNAELTVTDQQYS